MWNRLATPLIDDREGIDGGGEVTSAKEQNLGRGWLSAAAIIVEVGVAVGFLLCFMACAIKNKEQVGIQGVSACTFITQLYEDLWEHVA